MDTHRNPAKERWLAVGQSGLTDARAAGKEAAAQAVTGDDPKLLIVFCGETHDLDELLAGIRDVAGDTPLIGNQTLVVLAVA